MAAVIPYLEARPNEREEPDISTPLGLGALGETKPKKDKLDVDGSKVPPLSAPHTELTKLLWARKLMVDALSTRTFSVELDAGSVWVRVTPEVPENIVPWHKSAEPLNRFQLFSTNSKMACPTFDLPAGYMSLGGACPGAQAAQSTVMADTAATGAREFTDLVQLGRIDSRRLAATEDGAILKEQRISKPELNIAICTRCYATGGKYGEVVVQFSEVARMAFVARMLLTPEGTKRLNDLMLYTIVNTLDFLKPSDPSRRFQVKPIRVHSSGDFYSYDYATFWLNLAANVQQYDPSVRFWAPTRTQVKPGWVDFWDKQSIPSNFIIRPSAYHIGDPAPPPLHPTEAAGPGNAKGTSVLFPAQSKAVKGNYFDHQCGVYDLAKGNKTCAEAKSPGAENSGDGKTGCRACWTRPDLAVNYVVH
jgi:hypothetical protein